MIKNFLLFCFYLILSTVAYGQSTITFDDISAAGINSLPPNPIANGYQGFNWNNFYVLNTTGFPPSGFVNGTISISNVAASAAYGFPQPIPYTASLSSANPFILVSGYFTSAHQNAMSLEITGLNGTTTVFDQTFIVNIGGPSFITFPSLPLTEVDFLSSGGVAPGPGYLGGAPQMVLDNLTISPVPEPEASWLVVSGFSMLAFLYKRRN